MTLVFWMHHLEYWLDLEHPEVRSDHGAAGVQRVVSAIRGDDQHPPWGSDWTAYLGGERVRAFVAQLWSK